MRRELSNGRWDRVLKRRMVELSVADNYDDAKHEWIATGNVWWSGNGEIPDWVRNTGHQNYCLCGHGIVYHFHIKNTENGNEDVVGSDHINSYLIIRQIAQELKIDTNEVTDEQVAEWIKVRVGSMKAEAWWAENGEMFEERFNFVKEYDLWNNTRRTDWYWDASLEMTRPRLALRKKGSGTFGNHDYKMASVVWRWNHPNNPKNQQRVHGYPNKKLMMDINWLFMREKDNILEFMETQRKLEEKKAEIAEKRRLELERREAARLEAQRKWEEERPAREAAEAARKEQQRLQREKWELEQKRLDAIKKREEISNLKSKDENFEEMCSYYGIQPFGIDSAKNDWERTFLSSIKSQMSNKKELTQPQLTTLKRVLTSKPTEKQIKFLIDLGYEDVDSIKSKNQASKVISRLLESRKD
tara:strand:+ start:5580 stop:6824 length:1245 start_codon:yes stop_codon:yes gene_type:complete